MVAFSGVGKLRRDTRIIGADIVMESITPATAGFEARPNGQPGVRFGIGAMMGRGWRPGSEDYTANVWDAEIGKELLTLSAQKRQKLPHQR
jgi:hypothetical protein